MSLFDTLMGNWDRTGAVASEAIKERHVGNISRSEMLAAMAADKLAGQAVAAHVADDDDRLTPHRNAGSHTMAIVNGVAVSTGSAEYADWYASNYGSVDYSGYDGSY